VFVQGEAGLQPSLLVQRRLGCALRDLAVFWDACKQVFEHPVAALLVACSPQEVGIQELEGQVLRSALPQLGRESEGLVQFAGATALLGQHERRIHPDGFLPVALSITLKFGPQALELRLGMGGVRPRLEGRLQRLVGLTETLVLEPDVELGQSRVIGRIEHERT